MPTLKAKVESYVGTLSAGETTNLVDFIVHSSAKLMSSLPAPILYPFSTKTTVTGDGLTVQNKRIFGVEGVNGYSAREVPASDRLRYTGSTSLFKASDNDPVFWVMDGKVYIQGATAITGGTTSGYCHLLAFPTTVTVASDTSITGLPLPLERLAIIDSAIQVLSYRANEKLKTSMPAALDLSTQYSELDTDLDTEEDIELAGAKIQEIQIRITEYSAKVQSLVGDYSAIIKEMAALRTMYNDELQILLGSIPKGGKNGDDR